MALAFVQDRVRLQAFVERKVWTSEDSWGVLMFAAQSFAMVCAGVVVYSLGPILGMALMFGSLAVWPLISNQPAGNDKNEEGSGDQGSREATTVNLLSRCTDLAWLGNGRWGMSRVSATRPTQQGA